MPRTKTSSSLELLVELDRDTREPLHRQLERGLRDAIRDGRLEAGRVLPSSRALASQLGVSRGIVVETFEQLVAEGYVVSRPGGSTRVTATARAPAAGPSPAEPRTYAFDFRPGRPDVRQFPRAAWLRSVRRVLATAPSERLTYGGGHGVPELRAALATYLNRVRGTSADPSRVVISNGFAQGLGLTMRVLAAGGTRVIAVEDPSDPEYRATIETAGLRWIAIPVDDDGLVVDRLAASDADAVVVTAVHQYPTGATLSAGRRTALVAWAARRGAVIVEDDYDAEFRYDRQPIGALQGLRPDRVVYAGSASKVLAPGLRLGWLVVPERLVGPMTAAKEAADMGSAAFDQLALADLLERGELDHHLRRMRPIYRGRRDALLGALSRHLPDLTPTGISAGLHLPAWLPPELEGAEAAIVAAADRAGIAVASVSIRRVAPGPAGLLFGYGVIDENRIDDGIRALAGVIAGFRTRRGGTTGDEAGEAGEEARPVIAVYGTLRRGERNHALLGAAEHLGTGTIRGRLWALDATTERAYGYPALVPGVGGLVVVELYRLAATSDLRRIDELEAYDPADEPGSEYLRRRLSVEGGPVETAWAYVIAGSLPADAQPLPRGDWVKRRVGNADR
jgi:GntR family transcriptional regulator / MocR family aminotransferase